MAKNEAKTLNNVKMWKIFRTEVVVVVVVFFLFLFLLLLLLLLLLFRILALIIKQNDKIQPFHFCLRQQIVLGNNNNDDLEYQATIIL